VRVGTKVKTRWHLPEAPPMAITGNQIVLQGRKVVATDDRDLHPRTAIGIDYDRHRILIMVVDGRQDFSRGYTMVEVARRLREFGAEAALNFDGGGSSTMVAKRGDRLRVLNSPSDGRQRRVPNGVQVVYKPYADRRS
jgi:exopolysaccharide biosynthesis protein